MDVSQFLIYCAFDQGLNLFDFQIQAEWGANHPQHRLLLKKESQKSVFASISHCPSLGGFVGLNSSHPGDLQVGFDIEEVPRVSLAAVERISNHRDQSPSCEPEMRPALLWSAREAAFKALLGDSQPLVVSQIWLSHWQERNHGIWSYSFTSPGTSPGVGYAWVDEGAYSYALALWTPRSQIENGCRTSGTNK